MERSIFIDREDSKAVEEEELNLFLKGVLEQVGVPLDDVWPDILLTTEQKVRLRSLLAKLDIDIIDEGDRCFSIYHEDSKLAEWSKPNFILRKDIKARSLEKKLYFEMVIKTWSVFDKEEIEDE
jgi:hypothetical protein